ncbi:MAG: type II toxin-antitoxin system RelE/ParE family toxin [Alphaproteobacteria bacterium]|nr:type II toxin-antitoxin system RelE/ParE family toxin [Alphaproteobacteria bacterium]MDE2042042.1 type II toxin-antitoxin system RelE/ParE family toxin [Alphaproteobacteria bacterium]
MVTLKQTATFNKWFVGLRDGMAQKRILIRLGRLELGNFGDAKSVGSGVSELRIHYGPGYRLYYTLQGQELVLLLCGGDKDSQARDIELAKKLAKETE